MAWTFDQALGATQVAASASSIPLTTGAAVAAGATIFGGVIVIGTTLSSVTDGTNTYTVYGPDLDVSSIRTYSFAALCPAGLASSSTITANLAGSGTNRMIAAMSATGGAAALTQDGSTGTRHANNETSYTGASVTTTNASDILIAVDQTNGAGNPTNGSPGAGWTVVEGGASTPWSFSAGGGQLSASLLYNIVSATGTNSSTGTWSSSQTGGVGGHVVAAFQAAAAAAPGYPAFLPSQAVPFMNNQRI